MLIGIDASRAVRARRTGTENYSLQLIRHLLRLESEHRFRLYCQAAPSAGWFGSGANGQGKVEVRVMPFPRLWTHIRLGWEMLWHPPDVLFVPAHVLPLVHPARSVVTVHDLGYLYHPQAHPRFQRWYLDWSTRYSARTATWVLADSQATADDLVTHYGIDRSKVWVVYPGWNETLAPVRDVARLEQMRRRYSIANQYVLYLGTLQPRKNLARLVEAFGYIAGHRGRDLQLVLAGGKGWLYEPLLRRVQELGLADRVIFTGYVPDEDVAPLLSGAVCFAFPSLYEGFGFPVLEAMACGTPVVCANSASLPEVAGDAAWLVDPLDVEAIAEGLDRVLNDDALRAELIERGFANVRRFSWQRCARETMEVLGS